MHNDLLYFLISLSLVSKILASPNSDGNFKWDEVRNLIDNNEADFSTCSNNPEEEMTTIEVLKNAGYPTEEHFVKSEDGYILSLHRIPGPTGSRAVLLHHGLFETSFSWTYIGKKKALAYQLADNGYDVWMGNSRGNVYSRRHTSLSARDSAFWNFSWHEMGSYDLPAEIEYITTLKNESLFYVGHSMGTTLFFVMSNERPEFLSKVELMIGLGPAAYMDDIKGLALIISPYVDYLEKHIKGPMSILSPNPFIQILSKCFCNQPVIRNICRDSIFSLGGFNPQQFNVSLIPLLGTHAPAGTSLKTVLHFNQLFKNKKFMKYDYGVEENIRRYNSSIAPEYDLSKVNIPVSFFYGQNDFLTPAKAVLRAWKKLPKKVELFKMEDPNFTHLDFIVHSHASQLVNSKILLLFKKYKQKE